MENEQTAVEWLEAQFRKVNEYRETHAHIVDEYFQKEFKQAKQIEKEQQAYSHMDGTIFAIESIRSGSTIISSEERFEQYYNKNYGKETY